MKSICKASTNWIDGFYCFIAHMCQKLEAEKVTLPRSHTIFLRYQVDFNSRKKEREKERDDVVLASTLFIKK